ncbi:RBBP9/YdeN family alpha/beta hydrolase [Hymenobacter coccineus]|uniref:Alpha/beta hydrolase n=1 Tax=Hymenobacter coccineus TaxID=1908235 RepID=A0A1G1SZK1_9BACT|nr:alpha/beta fold hydrolase [Hymenobacter coccineus]OGX84062.1 hypothetical protein BEN49_11655 [Hymenobacter coccineus]
MSKPTHYFVVPGLGGSGPQHWQTLFEQAGPHFTRIEQRDWDAPDCAEWVAAIAHALAGAALENVVLVGHSLGCVAIAQWARAHPRSAAVLKGALLVAPADIEAPRPDPPLTTGFVPIPLGPLPFRSLVAASTNDPWVTWDRAQHFAAAWGSELVDLGPAGHVNPDAGFGPWPAGWALLERLG